MSEITLYKGDCLIEMNKIADKSVDLILTDPPYGTTACKWDSVIPFDKMWEQLNRVIKDNSGILLFGNEPFTSVLICSNLKNFKYRWDWNKHIPSGLGYAKYRPMQQTEDVCVFSKNGNRINYYPQMMKRNIAFYNGGNTKNTNVYGEFKCRQKNDYVKLYDEKYPVTLIEFNKVRNGSFHPTQKPVPLLEYLIKTYTKENEWVLDFTMGSGSTGVACINTNRNFIGIEKDEKYFEIAKDRIEKSKESIFDM